jgi:predicted NAD/FAD-binding protein
MARNTEVLVVGGGAAAIATAHRLIDAGVDVEILEAGPALGGNCTAVTVPTADGGAVTVDAGVSDFNRRTFVRFDRMVRELGLVVRPIDESASTMYPDGTLAWTSRDTSFADDIARFRREAPAVLGDLGAPRLGDLVRDRGYSAAFVDVYLEPRAGGAFPMPNLEPSRYDARTLAAFWQMHGLVGDAPRERVCIEGGMARYCAAFERSFRARGGRVTTGARVTRIRRGSGGAYVECLVGGGWQLRRAEHVVLTMPPAAAARVLVDADVEERHALQSIRCQTGQVYVHTDARLMPADRDAWGAFNYVAARAGAGIVRPTITFYPHRLAGVAGAEHVFVTLNPCIEPRRELVIDRRTVLHPVASTGARRSPRLRIQGRRNTWYASSYLLAPFLHEQAYASGHAVAAALLDVSSARDVRVS